MLTLPAPATGQPRAGDDAPLFATARVLFTTWWGVRPDPTDTSAGVHTVRRMSNSKGAPAPLHRPRHLVWLTITDVLTDLGIDRGTFDKWRKRGAGPRMKQLPNRTWRIRGDWYDAWLANLPGEDPYFDGGSAVAA